MNFIVNCSGANVSIKVQSFFYVDDIFFRFFLSTCLIQYIKGQIMSDLSCCYDLSIKPMKIFPSYGYLKLLTLCFFFNEYQWRHMLVKKIDIFSLVFGQLWQGEIWSEISWPLSRSKICSVQNMVVICEYKTLKVVSHPVIRFANNSKFKYSGWKLNFRLTQNVI